MATQTMLVRLRPYNPKRGCLLRRFTYRGIRFMEDRGWYRVDEDIAGYLKGVRQVDSDPDSSLAFDVCTEEEARALEEKERKEKRRRARVQEAINVNETEPDLAVTSVSADDEDIEDEDLAGDAGIGSSPDLSTADLPQNQGKEKGSSKASKSSRRK